MGLIIILMGPSGIGKGYIKQAIKDRWPFFYEPVWYTTRGCRRNNADDRICISEKEFKTMQNNNQFKIVDIYCEHKYGLSINRLPSHPFMITELRKCHFLNYFTGDNIFSIGLIPETLDFLRFRLTGRRTEVNQQVELRLETAEKEIEELLSNQGLFSFFLRVNEQTQKNVVNEICKSISPLIEEQ